MKNTSLIVSIISLVAAITFGVLYLTGVEIKKNDVAKEGEKTEITATEGDIVYIERKSARWKGSNLLHTVTSGETLHTLSQVYGVRLDQLSKLNRIRPSDPLSEQQTIKLR